MNARSPDMMIEQHVRQAMAMQERGQAAKAIDALQRLIPRYPANPTLNFALARLHVITNKPEQGAYFLERAEAAAPRHPDVLLLKAVIHESRREHAQAVEQYDKVLSQNPDNAEALSGKAGMLLKLDRPDEAFDCMRRAVAAQPDDPSFRSQLGIQTLENGAPHEACAILREACALAPRDPGPHASLAYAMNYDDVASAEDVFDAHVAYGRVVEAGVPIRKSFSNTPDPDRPIRIAFVSSDLREHSVAYFVEPILEHHDPDKLFIACYSIARRGDDFTARLRSLSDLWRDVGELDFQQLRDQFAKDSIDIAVDLAGHSAGNRLLGFAARPTPVAITYCGYPNTTGLSRVTARLIDDVTDPAPAADRLAVERLVRIDGCFLCYRARPDAPEPVLETESEPLVFGSFNATKKYSPRTLDAWAEILKQTPGSQLLLKHRRMRIPDVQRHFRDALEQRGVDPDRLMLALAVDDTVGHLKVYNQVDIALDPFPYNGTTTTCEALWMGVPVVTLAGDRHQARVGASLLRAVGLDDLVADSFESYVQTAVDLAEDPTRRLELRRGMRDRVGSSVLCDAPGFAARFERAVRDVWRAWCEDPT